MKYTLVALLCCAVLAYPQSKNRGGGGGGGDDESLSRTKTFPVSKGGLLDVHVNGGEIHVATWEKSEVTVTAYCDDERAMDGLRMSSSGNTVTVDNRNDDHWSAVNSRYEISVPRDFELKLKTSTGDIALEGALHGKVRGTTAAGDIKLGEVTGAVDLNTSGGNITTGSVDGDVTVQTSGGDIRLGNVTGLTDVTTSGGNIQMENVKNTLHARTSGGDIIVGDVGGEATLSTSGGNVSVGRVSGSARLTTAGGDIELDGASGTVKANTAGGNIRLQDITGSIEAKTAGGDIHAQLNPGGKGPSRLVTASGSIILLVPDNARATINARIKVWGYSRLTRSGYAIQSDFAAKNYDTDDEDHAIIGTYVLNGGGDTIALETVNADIQIRKVRK